MGRRSAHTAEELRELIIQAATELIQESGFGGLSAREIARRISYSPGTLYNVFEDLDDLVPTIEGRLLDKLTQALSDVPASASQPIRSPPRGSLRRIHARKSEALEFAVRAPSARGKRSPRLVSAEARRPCTSKVEDALQPLAGDVDPEVVRRSAKTLWAGVHGITSLSTADKLSIISTDSAGALLDDLRQHAPRWYGGDEASPASGFPDRGYWPAGADVAGFASGATTVGGGSVPVVMSAGGAGWPAIRDSAGPRPNQLSVGRSR